MAKLSKQQLMVIVAVFGSIILLSGLIVAIHLATKEEPRKEVLISNIDKRVENIPEEKKDNIMSVLDGIIKLNNSDDINTSKIKDAVIREGSESQIEVTKGTRYTGTFIVDIKSLQQSYRVSYSYTSNKNDIFASGYPALASCLKSDELIYGEFNCKDSQHDSSAKTDDPLLNKLPYKSNFYTISGIINADTKSHIVIQVMMNLNSTATKKAFNQYIKEAENWITSQGGTLSNYTIEYRNLMNQIVTPSELK